MSETPTPTFDELRVRAEAWTAPISEASPTGASAKFDPAYEAVAKEMAKLDSALAVPIDWPSVIDQSGTLLKTTTKDMLLSVYVANGLFATKGLGGLATGLVLVTDLMDKFWPTMFPEIGRMKARANAVSWLIERVGHPLTTAKAKASDRADILALQVAAKRLGEVARDKFGNSAPAFGPVLEAVERLRASLPPEAPPPAPAAPQPEAAPGSPSPPPAADGSSAAPATFTAPPPPAGADASDYLRSVGAALAEAAGPLRRANLADPTPYRMLRVGLYLHLTATPTSNGGKTRVPPLPPAVRGRMDKLVENAKWTELIDEAESALAQSRFCLDLHRYTAQALDGLGDGHGAARKAVIAEVAGLLHRFPDWPGLSAADGSPMASTLTRTWLDSEAGAPAGGGGKGSTGGGSANGVHDAARMAEARKLAASGKLAEALAISQAAVSAAPTGLARFHTRLEMAELAAAAGQPALARAIYEDLDREMGQRGLESWDPALAARCLEGLLQVLRSAAKSSPGVKGGVEQAAVGMIYDRLCRLDPAAVLRLGA